MRVGIVGAEGAKFSRKAEGDAKRLILSLLQPDDVVVSGGCHLGGIDLWAEQAASHLNLPAPIIHRPVTRSWASGYKPRNLLIAQDADVLHNIVVDAYPDGWDGMTFPFCYHCGKDAAHVKSGGCWTAKQAQRLGKPAHWHVVRNHAGPSVGLAIPIGF